MENKTNLGDKIRYIRKQSSLTQKDFGKILKESAPTIALWENNKRTPDSYGLLKISQLFNVSIDWLLSTEDKTVSIKVPQTENTITIIGRNGTFKTYIVDDSKIEAIKAFTETLAKESSNKKK